MTSNKQTLTATTASFKPPEGTKSEHNPKYDQLPGEFFDAKHSVLWNCWTSLSIIREIEEKFAFRSEDVILATFPKSGTTLVQEILWLLYNNVDTVKAKEKPVHIRVPFLELQILEDDGIELRNHIEILKEVTEGPRLIKTHLPYRYLSRGIDESGPRIIHVLRNPKDTMVSYFHFYRGVDDYGPWPGDWNTFFQMWIEGHIVSGDWFDVTAEWWTSYMKICSKENSKERRLVLFYEDLLKHPRREVEKIASFCDKEISEDQMAVLLEHTKFDSMKANSSTNYTEMPGVNFSFMRKGQVGDWKNYFTVAQSELFDHVFAQRLKDCEGLNFRFT